MIDQFAKEYLHSDLRDVRETMLWKLGGVGEFRRPLTSTGTNLLGLIKHLTIQRPGTSARCPDARSRTLEPVGRSPATATSCGLLRMSHAKRIERV